jgi:hypothetical protein
MARSPRSSTALAWAVGQANAANLEVRARRAQVPDNTSWMFSVSLPDRRRRRQDRRDGALDRHPELTSSAIGGHRSDVAMLGAALTRIGHHPADCSDPSRPQRQPVHGLGERLSRARPWRRSGCRRPTPSRARQRPGHQSLLHQRQGGAKGRCASGHGRRRWRVETLTAAQRVSLCAELRGHVRTRHSADVTVRCAAAPPVPLHDRRFSPAGGYCSTRRGYRNGSSGCRPTPEQPPPQSYRPIRATGLQPRRLQARREADPRSKSVPKAVGRGRELAAAKGATQLDRHLLLYQEGAAALVDPAVDQVSVADVIGQRPYGGSCSGPATAQGDLPRHRRRGAARMAAAVGPRTCRVATVRRLRLTPVPQPRSKARGACRT